MAAVTQEQPKKGQVWSPYQQAIFEEARTGTSNVVIRARAGCGKTTTILEAIKYIPRYKRIVFCAFSKANQQELERRVPPRAEARTIHSLGLAVVESSWGKVQKELARTESIMRKVLEDNDYETRSREGFGRFKAGLSLLSLAKNSLIYDADGLYALAVEQEESAIFWPELFLLIEDVLERCKVVSPEIDFNDMIWLPVALNLPVLPYDVIFVDEVQDLNPCQIALVKQLCKKEGRIFAVGDDRQAIYGFRGASTNNVRQLITELDAKVMSLPICYRCGKEIVRYVQRTVPDLEVWEGAEEGRVVCCNSPETATAGDFVVSRTNVGAFDACLRFLAHGKKAYMAGRDIGKGLRALIERSDAETIEDLLGWLTKWYETERGRAIIRYERLQKSPEEALERLGDQFSTLHRLAMPCEDIAELRAKVGRLLTSDSKGIRCSTVHRAKGLESDRVWVLANTFRTYSEECSRELELYTKQDVESLTGQMDSAARKALEESNLWYVATSRPRQDLRIVGERKIRYPIRCATCSVDTTIPFPPSDGKNYYCDECYQGK